MHAAGCRTLEDGRQLVFGRTFEGWSGKGKTYFEILQEYAHVAGIHWRSEQRAYCRFNEHGDIDHVVSITSREDELGLAIVSFRRESLEEYLAVSDSMLVRMFDFTLLRRESFSGWSDDEEDILVESDDFFYRQKVSAGHAAYTRGVQIVRSARTRPEIFSAIKGDWFGQQDRKFVEFIAYDWRNKRITKISTDPSATTNYFDAEGNSLPYEVSPAFFRPEVLLKYKADREKYKVRTRDIECRAAWSLRGYDVNEAGQVHAYICYLRNLPYSEQLHWASFNEAPKTGISERAVVTDFRGEFSHQTDPLEGLLSITRRWADQDVPWWKLREVTLLERVSTPRTASRDEWAEAFMDLSKLIIEGFNVSAIRTMLKGANLAFDKTEGSLILLEKLLALHVGSTDPKKLEGLRTVQLVRSKVKGHSSGTEAAELIQNVQKEYDTFSDHFDHICKKVAGELEQIEHLFS